MGERERDREREKERGSGREREKERGRERKKEEVGEQCRKVYPNSTITFSNFNVFMFTSLRNSLKNSPAMFAMTPSEQHLEMVKSYFDLFLFFIIFYFTNILDTKLTISLCIVSAILFTILFYVLLFHCISIILVTMNVLKLI